MSAGEEVLVVTDPERRAIAERLVDAARGLEAEAVLAEMSERPSNAAEPPKAIASAMTQSPRAAVALISASSPAFIVATRSKDASVDAASAAGVCCSPAASRGGAHSTRRRAMRRAVQVGMATVAASAALAGGVAFATGDGSGPPARNGSHRFATRVGSRVAS